jgi:TPR repeat protein
MTKLLYYSERMGCGATLRLDSGEPCLISIAQSGVRVKKSRYGWLGAILYNETNIYLAAKTGLALDLLFPEKLVPITFQNPVLNAFTNAVWHCSTAAEVSVRLNKAVLDVEQIVSVPTESIGNAANAATAILRGDYLTALRILHPLAREGDPKAQCFLASMYENGQGVPKDMAEAVRWYSKAAAQDYAEAQYMLAVMYGKGQGVPKDYVLAVALFRKAADQGYAAAQFGLGIMYESGDGVTRDYPSAVKWYCKAAEQGHAKAQYNLGGMYSNGQGVSKDLVEAASWYRKSADQGLDLAQLNLGAMYGNGEGLTQDYVQAHKWLSLAAVRFPVSETENRTKAVNGRTRIAAKMTPGQIAEAEQLARDWRPGRGSRHETQDGETP